MRFLVRLLVSALVIFGVAYLFEGALLELDPADAFGTALVAAIVLAVVNATLKPIAHLVSLPVTLLTLGLFALVVNAAMLYVVAWAVPGLDLVGFWQTVLAALLISIATSVLTKLLASEGGRR
ncbi:MAG: phage holin family protein [Coriobacteriia bacterium]|nr:phage holin family protein [Coriobacteriia bacterium]